MIIKTISRKVNLVLGKRPKSKAHAKGSPEKGTRIKPRINSKV